MSVIILFEGIDGSGKSTAVKNLKEKLESENIPAIIINGPVSRENIAVNLKKFNKTLVDDLSAIKIQKINEFMAFAIDRIEQFNAIKESASSGVDFILVDRSFVSSLAYQRLEDDEQVDYINRRINYFLLESFKIKFDYIVFLNADPRIAAGRIINRAALLKSSRGVSRHTGTEINESDNAIDINVLSAFLSDMSNKYLNALAETASDYSSFYNKYAEIDANGKPETVLKKLYDILKPRADK